MREPGTTQGRAERSGARITEPRPIFRRRASRAPSAWIAEQADSFIPYHTTFPGPSDQGRALARPARAGKIS